MDLIEKILEILDEDSAEALRKKRDALESLIEAEKEEAVGEFVDCLIMCREENTDWIVEYKFEYLKKLMPNMEQE